MIFKSESKQSDLNGFLDRGSHAQGDLRFETAFRVDGKFTGTVESEGSLIVGEEGEIEGEVRVGQLFVTGTLRGTVQASRKVQIAPGGKVFADLETPSLVIEDGALFEGRCSMSRESAAGPKLVATAAAVPATRER